MRVWRVVVGAASGLWLALLPALVAAQEEGGGRTLERSEDWTQVMLFTVAGFLGVLLLATLGYLYRMRRGVWWDFQQTEDADAHDAHH